MGNVSDKQVLKKYWNNSRKGMTASRDNREVKRCFDLYDKNRSGALEKDEAFAYIDDILRISGLDTKILEEATSEGCPDPQAYYHQVVDSLFKEMDRNQTGTIEFDELVRPKVHLWEDFLRFVSVQTLHELRNEKEKMNNKDKDKDNKDKKTKKQKKSELGSYPTRKPRVEGEESEEEEAFEEIEDEHHKVEQKVSKEIAQVGIVNIKNLRTSHRSVDHSGIMNLRESNVQAVVEFLGISSTHAQALLAAYRWDKEKLLEDYVENPEKACKAAGLTYPLTSASTKKDSETTIKEEEEPEEIECSICWCDSDEYTKIDACGHAFCDGCWKNNFETSIKEGKTFDIKCMHQGCTELVPDYVVKKIVDAALWEKYSTFLAKSFVEGNKQIRWCPAPGCGKAIVEKIYEGSFTIGKCACGFLFCYECNEEAHTPCSCDTLVVWKEKNSKDLSSIRWMMENTKPCPKCKASIEKNDGCFMMTCLKCHFQFCWLCLGDWSTHSNHFECSKYKSKNLNNKPEWLDGTARPTNPDAIPEEFMHYLDRFMQWSTSLNATDKTWDVLETKINAISAEGLDPSFALDAYRQLRESRRIVKYICVQICCESEEKRKQLNQLYLDSLEMVTEKLGRALGADPLKPAEIRTLTKVSRKAIRQLLSTETPFKK